jgi:hypothetical protein
MEDRRLRCNSVLDGSVTDRANCFCHQAVDPYLCFNNNGTEILKYCRLVLGKTFIGIYHFPFSICWVACLFY